MAEHLENGCAAYIFHADTEGLNFRKSFIDVRFKRFRKRRIRGN